MIGKFVVAAREHPTTEVDAAESEDQSEQQTTAAVMTMLQPESASDLVALVAFVAAA